MRPLWVEFPSDTTTFPIDDTFLLGSAMLVKPVTAANQKTTEVYLPNSNVDQTVWYDALTLRRYYGGTKVTLDTPIERGIPVFHRGGTIIPKKSRLRRSSTQMANDPFTLIVSLDSTGTRADGELYVDDGDTFDYKQGKFIHLKFSYHTTTSTPNKHVLDSFRVGGPLGVFSNSVERIVIVGTHAQPKGVLNYQHKLDNTPASIPFAYGQEGIIILKKPVQMIDQDWKIEIIF